jgi:hydroxymethyl cephem carbamoyltransferase
VIILGLKNGHDGAIAALIERQLAFLLEPEKSSYPRHHTLTPDTLLAAAEQLGALPDVVAVGGWHLPGSWTTQQIGAGYFGPNAAAMYPGRFFGASIKMFSSSHERSHIMMAVGMAPPDEADRQVVLVWEGDIGAFYIADRHGRLLEHLPVMSHPGARYAMLYAIADPTFPEHSMFPRLEDAGKLMALAAYGDSETRNSAVCAAVADILASEPVYPVPKHRFRQSPIYNAGVEAGEVIDAAALLSDRLFCAFRQVAEQHLPAGLPLRISGGCGLNCDWNRRWRDHGQFSSVFVPPCTDDSGSALGTAIDALYSMTGVPHVSWTVYAGLEFEADMVPPPDRWQPRPFDAEAIAGRLAAGHVAAWVQDRWEIGPRALGHRSLLADPSSAAMRSRLNRIKEREQFRPIAPCCRIEDAARCFDPGFDDPYMLYFQRVRIPGLDAIRHVDGSARVQTVTSRENPLLHRLLSATAAQTGVGVLCNTSLNLKGRGFINRMSDLCHFAERAGIEELVVGDRWFGRRTDTALDVRRGVTDV